MSKTDKLAALKVARANFKTALAEIEADLSRQRAERIAAATNAVESLVVEARAEGATWVEIKAAYGTTDHKTVTSIIDRNTERLRAAEAVVAQRSEDEDATMPSYINFDEDGVLLIEGIPFEVAGLDDGTHFLNTEYPLWDETYTFRNDTVAEFDGKTIADGGRAAEALRFLEPYMDTWGDD